MRPLRLSRQDQSGLATLVCDLVRTASPSTQEGAVADLVVAAMRSAGLQDVRVDRIGNVTGRVGPGHGPMLMLNGHMDTVLVSDPESWNHDPFGAEIRHDHIYGVGACDMKGGLAAMIYGAKLLQDSGTALRGDVVVASVVQEEVCEGLGTRVLVEEEGIRPDWVVLGEPTGLDVSRGHRGRMEMRIATRGRSAHAASAHLGDNAITTAARLVFGLELLSIHSGEDEFLGSGSLTVTGICSRAISQNTVPDRCELIVDRRLTLGDNETRALAEVQRIIAREAVNAEVHVAEYRATSYTGYACRARQSYPAWVLAEDHPLVAAATRAVRSATKRRPRVTRCDFSTEGVFTAGEAGIPTIAFGPGDPATVHTADERVCLSDVVSAAEAYAHLAHHLLAQP